MCNAAVRNGLFVAGRPVVAGCVTAYACCTAGVLIAAFTKLPAWPETSSNSLSSFLIDAFMVSMSGTSSWTALSVTRCSLLSIVFVSTSTDVGRPSVAQSIAVPKVLIRTLSIVRTLPSTSSMKACCSSSKLV